MQGYFSFPHENHAILAVVGSFAGYFEMLRSAEMSLIGVVSGYITDTGMFLDARSAAYVGLVEIDMNFELGAAQYEQCQWSCRSSFTLMLEYLILRNPGYDRSSSLACQIRPTKQLMLVTPFTASPYCSLLGAVASTLA